MNIIDQLDPNRTLCWLPPTRRTLTFNGTRKFLALPYQIISFQKKISYSVRINFTQTEPTPDTQLVGLPLPCCYDCGYTCGVYASDIESAVSNVFNSDWRLTAAGYPWAQRYSLKNDFVKLLEQITGKSTLISTNVYGSWGETKEHPSLPLTLNLWEEVSRIDPNFILTAPLLKPPTIATVKDLFTVVEP